MGFNLADYEPVEARIAAFYEEHPRGRIHTEMVSHEDGDYIFKAYVWRGDLDSYPSTVMTLPPTARPEQMKYAAEMLEQAAGKPVVVQEGVSIEPVRLPPDATGYAHDSAAALPANMKASALEVCETSAIGRALANLGYAPKGKRPSREEMSKSSGAGSGGSKPAPDPTSAAPRQEDPSRSDSGAAGDREVGTPHGEEAVPTSPSHSHEWIPAPNERMARLGWESCSVAKCQETRNLKKKGA